MIKIYRVFDNKGRCIYFKSSEGVEYRYKYNEDGDIFIYDSDNNFIECILKKDHEKYMELKRKLCEC